MTYLSEDPTFLAGGLLLLAGAFAVALRVTQQGKYLIRALAAVGLAAVVVVIEWLWVTDRERIEQVVYDLRRSVLESDVDGVLAHLMPNVQYVKGDAALSGEVTRALIRSSLETTRFEFIRISHLETSAGRQSRRGTAGFRALAKGSLSTSQAIAGIGPASTVWSLGFQETEPGVWKVNRITPVQIPAGALALPGTGSAQDRPRVGLNDPDPDPDRTEMPRLIGHSGPRRRRPDR